MNNNNSIDCEETPAEIWAMACERATHHVIRNLFVVLKRDLEEVRAYRIHQGGQSCGPPCNELLNVPPSTLGYLDRLVRRGLALTEGFKNE